MSYFRSYFEKNNTIIKETRTNTAKNPTTEIFYGSAFSKYIFKVDFSDLLSKVNNGDYVLTSGTTHSLHLTNTIFGDETFLGADRGTGRERAVSFDLILFKINESWDEGVGFDYENSDFIAGNKSYDVRPSNWYNRTTQDEWSTHGIYTTPEIIKTIHFDNGDEDIDVDITDYVNEILTGNTNYGLGLAFPVIYETITSESDQSVAFFTKYTQTFYEPFVETFFNDVVHDDRNNMVTDDVQYLYLFVTNGTNFYDLDIAPTVDILDRSMNVIAGLSDLQSIKVRKGIYKVEVAISGTLCPVKSFFFDKWKSLTMNGVVIPDLTQKFTLNPFISSLSIGGNPTDTKKYAIQVSGIKQNEKILRGENKKIVVNFRTINASNMNFTFDEVYYRMYIKEGHTNVVVHDWTLLDKANENFFFLNTEYYIPREYFIEFKAKINSEDLFYKEEIKFEVLSETNIKRKTVAEVIPNPTSTPIPTPTPTPTPTPIPTGVTFAILGDSGQAGYLTDTENVANGIKSFTTDFIIHVGDANYGTPSDIQTNFLDFWPQEYLDKMYFAFGNHDLNYDYGQSFLDNLPLVNSLIGPTKIANKLYCYDFVRGPIHFFVLNAGNSASGDQLDELADPNIQLSAQLDEIIPKITGSTSTWKIMVVHKPPYTNEVLHDGSIPLRLDYESLGVRVVLNGHSHDYEYIYLNNTAYMIQGLGGANKRCAVAPYVTGTQTTYCVKNGYTICQATQSSLTFTTYNVDGQIIDYKVITV